MFHRVAFVPSYIQCVGVVVVGDLEKLPGWIEMSAIPNSLAVCLEESLVVFLSSICFHESGVICGLFVGPVLLRWRGVLNFS